MLECNHRLRESSEPLQILASATKKATLNETRARRLISGKHSVNIKNKYCLRVSPSAFLSLIFLPFCCWSVPTNSRALLTCRLDSREWPCSTNKRWHLEYDTCQIICFYVLLSRELVYRRNLVLSWLNSKISVLQCCFDTSRNKFSNSHLVSSTWTTPTVE